MYISTDRFEYKLRSTARLRDQGSAEMVERELGTNEGLGTLSLLSDHYVLRHSLLLMS